MTTVLPHYHYHPHYPHAVTVAVPNQMVAGIVVKNHLHQSMMIHEIDWV